MPLLFISHKHADRKIAQALGGFIEERSTGRIKVFLSSNPAFEGPRFGKALNQQLRDALWKTEVLILLYTAADQDWSYCMWECGMAAHPQSANTTTIVFQCGKDVPAPFKDTLRANVRNADDLKRFTTQLLKDPSLFPSAGGAIAPDLKDAYIESIAAALHQQLAELIPPLEDEQGERWPTWPRLCVELPREQADKLEQLRNGNAAEQARGVIGQQATISMCEAGAAQLFGRQTLPSGMKFGQLLADWKERYPELDPAWFDSCCEQMLSGIKRGFPTIASAPMRELNGEAAHTPVVVRVRRYPFRGTVEFDLFFLNLSDPRAILVTSRMTPAPSLFHKRLGAFDPRTSKLKDLIGELEAAKRNRVPILTAEGWPLYVVHRSMVEQFMVKHLLKGDPNPGELTVEDLLADPEMRILFESSFAVVKRNTTLAQAKAAISARAGISDVFITETGTAQAPLLGLLTNVDIARAA